MGRYIECGEDVVYKYPFEQQSNLYLIHDMLGIGRLRRKAGEESYGNGYDVLLLIKKDVKRLKKYFDLEVKEIGTNKKLGLSDISRGELNFLSMINHILYYADEHPEKDVYCFDSEL